VRQMTKQDHQKILSLLSYRDEILRDISRSERYSYTHGIHEGRKMAVERVLVFFYIYVGSQGEHVEMED
jgi:hypothetical protein